MNLFRSVLLLLILSVAMQSVNTQTDTTIFNISPKMVTPGMSFTISYNPSKTQLAGKSSLQCVVHEFHTNFTWSAKDAQLVKKDSIWQSQFKIADDCALILCTFSNDSISDNGGAWPYVWMIAEPNSKKMMQGSFYAWGTMRNSFLHKNMPFVLDTASFKGNDVSRMWIRYEVRDHEASRPYVFKTSFTLFKQDNDIAKITSAAYTEINSILQMPNLSEQVWLDAKDVYSNVFNDKKTADSLEQVILEKFPNGIVARDKVIQYLYTKEKDPIK